MEERPDKKDSKLRRWVSNLQLESWQLELLITGFSIFLLATSLDSFDQYNASLRFNKLSVGNGMNPIFTASILLFLNTIPLALRFFLTSLLIHLLLRGFWVGIIGLSSVSNKIDFEDMNLRPPFKKFLPRKVQTLDELILFLDQISSVIFAYTYLVAFSVISIVLVGSFLLIIIGMTTLTVIYLGATQLAGIINIILFLVFITAAITAIMFFLDTLFFSFIKRSKRLASFYFPFYRFFSVISISFLYRSIYYHLITTYKKKQIAIVTIVLLVLGFFLNRVEKSNPYKFYPERDNRQAAIIRNAHYDDQRQNQYIETASIPSKFVSQGYLELFIRYSPDQNQIFRYLCPEAEDLNKEVGFVEGMRAGVESQFDSTKSINDILNTEDEYEQRINSSLSCLKQVYQVRIDGDTLTNIDLSYTIHANKGERGFLVMIPVDSLQKGKHVLAIDQMEHTGQVWIQEVTNNTLKMTNYVKIPFWTE